MPVLLEHCGRRFYGLGRRLKWLEMPHRKVRHVPATLPLPSRTASEIEVVTT